MPDITYLSKLVLPVDVSGTVTNVEFTVKDAGARQMIEDLGNALYWIGVTTTALTDGATTNPIVVSGDDVTAEIGGMASYDGLEFVWNGSAWQAMGHANFGSLAFESSAEGSYTPAGSVSLSETTAATTDSVVGVASNGTVPSFTVSGETATFNPGAMPTLASSKTFITAEQVLSASFSGTAATITVS